MKSNPKAVLRVTEAPPTDQLRQVIQFLTSMAETVKKQVDNSIEALLTRNEGMAGAISISEPRVNAMEVLIDEHAVRAMVGRALPEADVRLLVATIKINNDLERMGDLAVHIAHRVIALGNTRDAALPDELISMTTPVMEMVHKSLDALIFQDIQLADEVLRNDDEIDRIRDQVFEKLMQAMAHCPSRVAANFQMLLAARYLERIADHAENIAEDVIYWVRGVDVRHQEDTKHEMSISDS